MVPVDQILGSDPGDDWGDAGNSTSKSNCSKVFSGEDFMFMEAGTHPCAKCVSTFLTLPLWFPVVVTADLNFGSDPSDDFGEKWTMKMRAIKPSNFAH